MGRTPASWDLHTMDGVGGPNQSIRTRTRAEKSTFILIASMPLPQYMFMGQYIRKQKDEHQNKEKSVALLMVLWLPKKQPLSTSPATKKRTRPIPEGNNLANKTAQQVAQQLDSLMVAPILVDPGAPCLPANPRYTEDDLPLIQDQFLEGWWKTVHSKVILPKHLRKSFFITPHIRGMKSIRSLDHWE